MKTFFLILVIEIIISILLFWPTTWDCNLIVIIFRWIRKLKKPNLSSIITAIILNGFGIVVLFHTFNMVKDVPNAITNRTVSVIGDINDVSVNKRYSFIQTVSLDNKKFYVFFQKVASPNNTVKIEYLPNSKFVVDIELQKD